MAEAHQVPPTLYKYLRPERLDVLRSYRVRFSPRDAFEDDHELLPEYATFGNAGQIWRFIISKGLKLPPPIPPNMLVQLFTESPKAQKSAVEVAVGNISVFNQMGIFCLTEVCDCEQMWNEYAAGGGFVIGFDTAHSSFAELKTPGAFGKVCYRDAALESFLGMIESDYQAPLFRKRMKYAFEREWRSLRLFKDLQRHADGVFLAQFDPACLSQIIVRPDCAVRGELDELLTNDYRYAHIKLVVQT